MAKSKALSLLGIAQRANYLIDGEERVLKALKQGSIELIILASDAGDNIKKKIYQKSHYYQIPIIDCFTQTSISSAIGRNRTLVALTDKGLAKTIQNAINS